MKLLVSLLLVPALAFGWTYVEQDGTFYSHTNSTEATLTIRRSTEDYAEMYIEADQLCEPKNKLAEIKVAIDLNNKNKRYFGLLSSDSSVLFIRFDQGLIRSIEMGELIEFTYDDCVYEFVITGDPDELYFLTMFN